MRPSALLREKKTIVQETVKRYPVSNLRIFGSAAEGTDTEDSDLDLLVDALPGATLFDLGGLQDELECLLGTKVDLLTAAGLPEAIRATILAEARPV